MLAAISSWFWAVTASKTATRFCKSTAATWNAATASSRTPMRSSWLSCPWLIKSITLHRVCPENLVVVPTSATTSATASSNASRSLIKVVTSACNAAISATIAKMSPSAPVMRPSRLKMLAELAAIARPLSEIELAPGIKNPVKGSMLFDGKTSSNNN